MSYVYYKRYNYSLQKVFEKNIIPFHFYQFINLDKLEIENCCKTNNWHLSFRRISFRNSRVNLSIHISVLVVSFMNLKNQSLKPLCIVIYLNKRKLRMQTKIDDKKIMFPFLLFDKCYKV